MNKGKSQTVEEALKKFEQWKQEMREEKPDDLTDLQIELLTLGLMETKDVQG
jgi:hypothetical protein